MQPASAGATGGGAAGGGNRALRRWGPIAGIVVVIALVVGAIVVAGGDDGYDGEVGADTTSPAGTSAPAETAAAPTEPSEPTESAVATSEGRADTTTAEPAAITYPLSFSEAEEQGIEVAWDERCDTERGTIAVPDFFAPECFAPFDGDNGGQTSPGVTADTIKVVFYMAQEDDPIIRYITDSIAGDDTNEQQVETMQNVARYYEAFYELYGRTFEIVPFTASGTAADEVAARADAVRIAEEIRPFVVLGGPALTPAFGDELAARQVMCIACVPGQPTAFYADRQPYVWAIDANQEQKQDHVFEFVQKQLIGKPAEHSGDFVDVERTFAYVYVESGPTSAELAERFAGLMEGAGAPLVEVVPYTLDPVTIQQTALQTITRLKSAGVTTVIFNGDPVAPRDFTREATAQAYFPEWVSAAATLTDVTAFGRTYDQAQWEHAFGVTTLAARVDPTVAGYPSLYEWFNGSPPPADESIGVDQPNLALFSSVAQGAGPNLTPETWRDALFAGTATRRAVSAPSLSWGDQELWSFTDYHGIDDATALWWDPTATGPDELRREGAGMYQYVEGGARYLPGEWPTEPIALFDPAGAVSIYTTRPPGEEPGEYPSPAG